MSGIIQMNDFRADSPELKQAELEAVRRVLNSGWYILGREVEEFESRWAQFCGVQEAVGVASGMDAVEIAIRTCGIGPGDEVITTPMTAFATVLAIIRAGATPVLADIDIDTGLLSLESARRCVSPRTRAIVLVHLYGHIAAMDQWMDLCARTQLFLIEDCAQAHLAKWGAGFAGSFGAWGAYSFYPTKNLGTPGDGGALITNDRDRAALARTVRNYGQSIRYHHPIIGLNSRLDEIHAAILKERLKWLRQFTDRRRSIANQYFAHIDNENVSTLAQPSSPENHVFHLFVIRSDRRDELSRHLRNRGVESLSHYPIPIHRQESCLDIKRDSLGLSVAEAHARKCLSIPCHPNLTQVQIDRVVETINAFR